MIISPKNTKKIAKKEFNINDLKSVHIDYLRDVMCNLKIAPSDDLSEEGKNSHTNLINTILGI